MLRELFQQSRKDYNFGVLDDQDLKLNPYDQFEFWYNNFQEILKSHKINQEPNAMFLATSVNNLPSIRTVLLKDYSRDQGFIFFTNYKSRKGSELEKNPNASILFFWSELERQVRVEGLVEKIENQASDEYFYARPKDAQFAAITSKQSQVLTSREQLEAEYLKVKEQEPKRPADWGGYRLIPKYFEFWQGRESRLHDRINYKLDGQDWRRERLYP